MRYRGFYGLLYGLLLVAAAATAQDESIAEQEQDAIQSYLGLIFQKLESHKRYPSVAEQSGLSGRVVLRFTVRWDGEVIDPQITEISGHNSFGDAALQALGQVSQLPPFPDEIRRRELMVEVPITYQIENRSSPERAAANDELIGQLLRRAEQGEAEAQAELCAKYTALGDASPPDVTAVVKWCRRAAEDGYAEGQFGLGVMIFLGQGVPKDNAEAVKWYRRASEQGHARAQATLGAMYIGGGGGVPQDYTEALKWVRRAAEQDDRMGQLSLGVMYANGWSVRLDNAEAEKWFLKGLEDHDAEDQGLAQLNIGDMYAEGRNVPQSDAEAAKWYRMAAEQGLGEAQFKLGVMYASGEGVPENDAEAVKWYRMAAEQGHDGAQIALKAESVEKGLELSLSERRLIQMGLAAEGFDPGPADGLFGPRTRKVIGRWQTSRQEASTGYLDTESAKVLLASGREREVRENAQHQATTAERRGRDKQAAKEMWRCFAISDYSKTTALFTLTRVRSGSGEFGEVSVAGTTHLASFEIAGLNRRWDFGYNEIRDRYLYTFIVKPDGTGLYYDFSISSDGKASPRDHFKCRMSP